MTAYLPSYWQLNPQDVILVASMWRKGYTAGQILKALGDPPGLTRNAIIGKVHRMGLKQHNKYVPKTEPLPLPAKPSIKPGSPKQWSTPVPKEIDGLKDLPEEESKHAVHLFDVKPEQCRWLIGPMIFCGAPQVKNSRFSFCATHAKRGLTISYRSYDSGRFNKRW